MLYNRFVQAGDTVIDGGANAGLHSSPLADIIGPNGILHSFEPIPAMADKLALRLKDKSVSVHQKALSNRAGEVAFVVDTKTYALSHIKHGHEATEANLTVEAVRLDDVIKDRPVSFIKLDLEGADFLALQGAERLLTEDKPVVVFENGRGWSAKCNGYTVDDFFSFFERIGYNVYDMHMQELVRERWEDKDISFEFVAVPAGSTEEADALAALEEYWERMSRIPVFPDWPSVVQAVSGYPNWVASFR